MTNHAHRIMQVGNTCNMIQQCNLPYWHQNNAVADDAGRTKFCGTDLLKACCPDVRIACMRDILTDVEQ